MRSTVGLLAFWSENEVWSSTFLALRQVKVIAKKITKNPALKSMVQIAGCTYISKLTTHARSACNTEFSDLEGVSLILNVSLRAGVM